MSIVIEAAGASWDAEALCNRQQPCLPELEFRPIFPHCGSQPHVQAPRQARALAPDTMRQISDHAILTVAPGIEAALAMVAGAAREEVIFVTGSLFLVAEARAAIIGSKR